MGHALNDLVRHNIWATAQILATCRELDEETLNATVPGTYGTIIQTVCHLLNSEASYLYRLSGAWPAPPWTYDDSANLDVWDERAALLASTWEQVLTSDVDIERLGEARGDDDTVFAVRAGIFLTQAIHHANEHRAHICTILGARGIEPPDVSAWEYAGATGRSTIKSGPTA